jgi:hypothetical protein
LKKILKKISTFLEILLISAEEAAKLVVPILYAALTLSSFCQNIIGSGNFILNIKIFLAVKNKYIQSVGQGELTPILGSW